MVKQEVGLSSTEDKINKFHEMVGKRGSKSRLLCIKRFNLRDIYVTKQEREIVEKAIIENLKFIKIGLFTIMISTISAIEPREEI